MLGEFDRVILILVLKMKTAQIIDPLEPVHTSRIAGQVGVGVGGTVGRSFITILLLDSRDRDIGIKIISTAKLDIYTLEIRLDHLPAAIVRIHSDIETGILDPFTGKVHSCFAGFCFFSLRSLA